MKRLITPVLALVLSFSSFGQQDHYYQIFSIGECNNEDIELNLTPMMETSPDVLMLTIEPFTNDTYHYHLFNMHGVSIRQGKVAYNRTEIMMEHYPLGGYHLLVSTDDEDVQLFRIKKKGIE